MQRGHTDQNKTKNAGHKNLWKRILYKIKPVECLYYNQLKRCKFLNSSYKNIRKVSSHEFNKYIFFIRRYVEIKSNAKCVKCVKSD